MSRLRTAVIGVGYLGKFHAEKYAELADADLVGVVDLDLSRAQEVAGRLATKAYASYSDLMDQVDAVSVVVPTQYHHQVAGDFLRNGVHVLVEKPVTTTLQEADDLIRLAEERKLVFQVGHLERFNPVIVGLTEHLSEPRFIESVRIAPFKPRGTDVNVVLDLMIHDIDIIQHILRSPVTSIDSIGAPVFTDEEDIANARIRFANGCVANVTASRISLKSERKMRIFQSDSYITVDFQNKQFAVFRKGTGEMLPGVPNVSKVEQSFEQQDALRNEIESFLQSVRTGSAPAVTGQDGRKALEIALLINTKM